MTDATLRFVVELADHGIGKLKSELRQVTKLGAETASSTTKSGSQATRAINRIAQSEASARKRSVENAAARHAALRSQVADYNRIASAAVRGSDEQIAASLLAQKAQQRLARETAIAAGSQVVAYGRSGAAARHYERDLSRLARGALSMTGIFRGLRSGLFIASGAFLGGAGAGFLVKKVIEQSEQADATQKSLRAQLRASKISWAQYGAELDSVAEKSAKQIGVDDELTKGALTQLIRTTGSVRASEKLTQVTLDVSAGRHIALATSAGLVARVFSGNLGILKRYGIVLGSNVKTPLQALIALQAKFAGQSEAAGKTAAGAFGRAENSIHNFEEGLGQGLLPVIERRLNALTGAIDDEQLKRKARELGNTIATEVDGAITKIVHTVKDNWPEIERDFHDAEVVIGETATVAGNLAHWLSQIAEIVPAKGSLIELLLGGAIAKRLLLGKGAKTAAAGEGAGGGGAIGVIEGALAGLGLGGAAKKVGGARGLPLLRLAVPVVVAYEMHENKSSIQHFLNRVTVDARNFIHRKLGPFGFLNPGISPQAAPFGGPGAHAAPSAPAGVLGPITQVDAKTAEIARSTHDVELGWNAVKDALRATGAGLDQQKSKLEKIVAAERKRASALASSFDEAFSRLADDIGRAFDATTQRMLDNVSYRVRVVGKGIHEAFTLRGDELTPAERELAALDKIEQRRNFKRDIFDAREQLAQAIQIGDPHMIRDAERRLQDAQTEKRRYGLERRAELERKAADAARARAEKELQARRDLEKRQLDDQLAAIQKQADQGKISGAKAAKEIAAVLRAHGIDFKNAGDLLGKAFATQLQQDLDLVKTRADRVASAFERIADTKAKIHDLASEVARLATQLQRVQNAGPGAVTVTGHGKRGAPSAPPGARGPVGPSAPPGARGPVGGRDQPGPPHGSAPHDRQRDTPDRNDRRERRHRKDTAELVGLHPNRRELASAIEALHFRVRLPKRIDATYLRRLGSRTSIPHLERLIDYLEAQRLGALPHWDGGVVEGPAGRDVILARLTRRELVLNEPQQKGLKRRLGIAGGPHELFNHIRGLARFADGGVAGAAQRFAAGGVAGDSSYSSLLRMLTRRLARLELSEYRAQQNPRLLGELLGTIKASKAERARARHALDPVNITKLVSRQGGLSKRARTKLDERLSQEQAHPFLEGLLRATPTGTALGGAGRSGRGHHGERVSGLPGVSHVGGGGGMGGPRTVTVVSPIELDGRQIAVVTREASLEHAERGYTRKRGANRGKNLGMG